VKKTKNDDSSAKPAPGPMYALSGIARMGSVTPPPSEPGQPRPIVVVSGLPRSGTSMAMRMLDAGGMEIVTDGIRAADESNPKGYYEDERVKTLDKGADTSWLDGVRGKAVKIISFLLRDLPETHTYKVIFLHRNMAEVLASQRKMLQARGAPPDAIPDERMARGYREHLDTVKRLLAQRPCFEVLDLDYRDVVARPLEQATRIAQFVGGDLDVSQMASAVDEALYRQRGTSH